MKRKRNISYKNQNNAKKLKYKIPGDIINKEKNNICRCSSMAECQLPKLNTRVRFPSPAPTEF